jgi:uncharacterized SAM-binding protein YcdF (DUF218 family)
MFLFKKIASRFLFPLPFTLGLCWIGLILMWTTKRQRLGKGLVTVGLGLLTLLSYNFVASRLLEPLESQYPPFDESQVAELTNQNQTVYVTVLGGGFTRDERFPVTSQISDVSLKRLVEGIRIHRMLPDSKLLLSGGSSFGEYSVAKVMAETAAAIGVDEKDILTETDSRDTDDHAAFLKDLIGTNNMILVTSASHMPRAVGLLRGKGINLIPAAAGHNVLEKDYIIPDDFFPRVKHGSEFAERAFYEYLGLLWTRFTEL